MALFRTSGGSMVGRSSELNGEMCRRMRSVMEMVSQREQRSLVSIEPSSK